MKITAQDLLKFGVIDKIISEPAGGAHRHSAHVIDATGKLVRDFLKSYDGKGRLEIREERREKFLKLGTKLT